MNIPTKKYVLYLNVGLFVVMLTAMGCLFFILPRNEVSDYEKRKLCPPPQFSWNGLFEGKYIDSLDLFVADNFPFRDKFVETSFELTQRRGIRSEQIGFYDTKVVMNPEIEEKDTKAAGDSLEVEANELEEEATKSHGILIYKKMAIQVFGGDKYTAMSMANVINLYQEKLKDKAKVYLAVTPTHGEYYLPEKYRVTSERENINVIYETLKEGVISVDVCGELDKHKEEYIFFNTDHHWTGLGAYYAYVAFCKKADLEPVPLEEMERKVKNEFLGSLYWLTRDSRLKENIDSVVYYKPTIEYTTYAYLEKRPNVKVMTTLFAEYAKGPDSYGVYLGADHPLMLVETKVKNGRRAVVIKNSYGNPFSTYLVPHFEQLYIVDYRYYTESLLKLIEKNKITDVIFFTNSFLANTAPHITQTKLIMDGVPKKEKEKKKEIKSDSLKKETNKIPVSDSTKTQSLNSNE